MQIAISKEWCEKLATDRELQGLEKSILLYFLSQADDHQRVTVKQTHIAEAIQTARPLVSRAVKRIAERGYITLVSIGARKTGHSNTYQINDSIA